MKEDVAVLDQCHVRMVVSEPLTLEAHLREQFRASEVGSRAAVENMAPREERVLHRYAQLPVQKPLGFDPFDAGIQASFREDSSPNGSNFHVPPRAECL